MRANGKSEFKRFFFDMFKNSYKGYQMWNAEDRYN